MAFQIKALVVIVLHLLQFLLQLHRLLAFFGYQHLFFQLLGFLKQVPVRVIILLDKFRIILQLLLHLPHLVLAVPLHERHPPKALGSHVGLYAGADALQRVIVLQDDGGFPLRTIYLVPWTRLLILPLGELILHPEELDVVRLDYFGHVLLLELRVYVLHLVFHFRELVKEDQFVVYFDFPLLLHLLFKKNSEFFLRQFGTVKRLSLRHSVLLFYKSDSSACRVTDHLLFLWLLLAAVIEHLVGLRMSHFIQLLPEN